MKKSKLIVKPIAAFFPAMLLLLVGLRFAGLITIRNSSTDYENISRILKSPDPNLAEFADIYQYHYNALRLCGLLAHLIILLCICIGIRKGTFKKGIQLLRNRLCGRRLPDISTVQRRVKAFVKVLLQYGQISDSKRRYCVTMRVSDKQQSFLFAADKSEKPGVMDLQSFDVLGGTGEGLIRISIPKTILIWKRTGVCLITKGKPFRVVGEDRTTSRVHLTAGERISVKIGGTTIFVSVS